jgi:hypothetical protein
MTVKTADSPERDKLALTKIAAEIFGEGVWGEDAWRPRPLSSVEVMRLLVRVEREFDIAVPDSELLAANFTSSNAVLALVARHRRG